MLDRPHFPSVFEVDQPESIKFDYFGDSYHGFTITVTPFWG